MLVVLAVIVLALLILRLIRRSQERASEVIVLALIQPSYLVIYVRFGTPIDLWMICESLR